MLNEVKAQQVNPETARKFASRYVPRKSFGLKVESASKNISIQKLVSVVGRTVSTFLDGGGGG